MIRTLCVVLIALTIGSVFAVDAPKDEPQIAIIHFDQLKDGKLEGTAKDITFKPVVGGPNQTAYFGLRNDLYTPREIIVKILGLKESDYDLYIDANLVGVKKSAELESGIQVSFPGSDIPQAYREYYTMIRTRCLANIDRFTETSDNSVSKARALIQAIIDRTKNLEIGDNMMRTVGIIVVPKDKPLSLPGGHYVFEKPKNFNGTITHLSELISTIRREALKVITNELLRNDTLTIITPIDFILTNSAPIKPGCTVTITATLTNWTDRNITGKAQLRVPSTWTVKDVTTEVTMPGYGKSSEVKFEIAIPDTADINTQITVMADLMVENIPLKLSQTMDNPEDSKE